MPFAVVQILEAIVNVIKYAGWTLLAANVVFLGARRYYGERFGVWDWMLVMVAALIVGIKIYVWAIGARF